MNDDKAIAEVKTQVLAIQRSANDLVVSNELEFAAAEQFSKQILDAEKKVTARKEEITRPLMASLASIRDLFKPLELGIADAKKVVKAKRLAWQIEEDERIEKAKAKLAARVEKGTMRADTAAAKMNVIGEAPKGGVRTLQRLKITDETAIPREYMDINTTKITTALKAGIPVPGAELESYKSIV